jgi:arylsulfatase A-like enzyme
MSNKANKPNILLIVTDQQQGATVDPDSPCQTPMSDRLAAQGVRFSLGYTPVGLTGPAHASLLTGAYPHMHGNRNNCWGTARIRADILPMPIYPERLIEAGYTLLNVGDLKASRARAAEDLGFRNLTPREVSIGSGKAAAINAKIIPRSGWQDYMLYGVFGKDEDQQSDYRKAQLVIDEMPRLAAQDKPWMFRVKLQAPHDSFVPPQKYLDLYKDSPVPLPESFKDNLRDKPNIYRRHYETMWSGLTDEEFRLAREHYFAFASFVDAQIGRIIDGLDASGQADNTLVIVTSDHGDMAAAHKLFLKGVMPYEECYRVPLIVRWPGVVGAAGAVCEEFATWVDLTATMLDAAGAKPLELCVGRSIRPLLEGRTPADWPQYFYGQCSGAEYYYTQRILRDKRFKFIFNGFDFDELYDLREDPHEMRNLARDSAYQKVKEQMIEQLWAVCLKMEDTIGSKYPTVSLLWPGPSCPDADWPVSVVTLRSKY